MYVDGFPTVLDPIKSVQLSLLEKKTDPNKLNKADFLKKKTVKFTLPKTFPKRYEYFEVLLEQMYADLLVDAPSDADSIGIWIDYGTTIVDNSISLGTLNDIKMYSSKSPDDEDINVAYEFFKMTIKPFEIDTAMPPL